MAGAAAKAGGAGAQANATTPQPRTPTLVQRLSCASYIYFIPVFLVLNLLCFLNRYTLCIWLM